MTEKEKMLAGELYLAETPELEAAHRRAIELCEKLNFGRLSDEEREKTVRELLGKCGKTVVLGRGFWCDYGENIEVGENFYVNYDVVILDVCKVTIGNNCWIGTGCFIGKSANLPDYTIVAAQSNVVKPFDESYTVIGGNPAHVLKRGVKRIDTWEEAFEITNSKIKG